MSFKRIMWNRFLFFVLAAGVSVLFWHYRQTHRYSIVFDPQVRAWKEKVRQALQNPNSKDRMTVPSSNERSPASDFSPNSERGTYHLKNNEAINLEKRKDQPPRHKLLVTNDETGEDAYLSGEVIIRTDEIQRLPKTQQGVSFEVLRNLGSNTYIVGIEPASEIEKGASLLQQHMKIDDLKFDIVDRKIQPE